MTDMMRKKRKAFAILVLSIVVLLLMFLLSHNDKSSTPAQNRKLMLKSIAISSFNERGIDHELFNRYKEEAGAVSMHYPAQYSDHLWIELDHKRSLIRRIAFYDNRPGIHPKHSLVLISLHNDRDEPVKPNLYIKLFYNISTVTCMPLEYWTQIGGYKPVLRDYYGAYLMRVSLDYTVPEFVAVARDSTCSEEQLLPVIPVHADISESNGVHSVCTGKALYGDIDSQWVAHWIELNRALGASYITILIQDIADDVYDMLRSYQDKGIVEVVDWRVSVWGMHEQGMWGSLQECTYRNILRAQYLNLHDIDEVLMPQAPYTTWKDMMMTGISDGESYASFSFPNAYWFDIGYPIRSAVDMMPSGCERPMKLPEYFQRTDRSMNPEYKHPKPMLALDYVIASDIHFIAEWRNDKIKQFEIPPDIGQSFHYRTPVREEDYKHHNRTYDPSFMTPYVNTIMNNLNERFCKV